MYSTCIQCILFIYNGIIDLKRNEILILATALGQVKRANTKRQILCDFTHNEEPKVVLFMRPKVEWWPPGAGVGGGMRS